MISDLRKYLLGFIALTCISWHANAQKRYIQCSGESDSMSREFIQAMMSGPSEDIPALINYWEDSCGVTEVQNRARLIFAISENAYEPTLWDTFLYGELPWYENRLRRIHRLRRDSVRDTVINRAFDCVQVDGPFDRYTREFANWHLQNTDLKPSERIVLTMLSGDDTLHYQMLRETHRDSATIAAIYQDEVGRILLKPEMYFRIGLGVWKPVDNEVLGTHPTIFCNLGQWHQKWGWEVDFAFRPFPSRDSFQIKTKKVDIYSNSFSGWSSNAYVTRNLSRQQHTKLNLRAGIGWDGVALNYVEEFDEVDVDRMVVANSFSAVAGLEWVLKFRNGEMMSVGIQRHFTNYSDKRTDVPGGATSLRVGYSFGGVSDKDWQLEKLRFDPWEHELTE